MSRLLRVVGLFAISLVASMVSCADESARLESSCESYCEAQAAAGCPQGTLPEDQCKAFCGQIEAQLGGSCIAEYTATFECSADAGFECLMGFAIPKGGSCLSEAQSMNSCVEAAGCTSYCMAAVPQGCGGADMAACEASCTAERESYAEYFCDFEYDDLLACWGESGVMCLDGQPGAGNCGSEVLEVGDCLTFDLPVCEAYCWASDSFGCGEGCQADCEPKVADTNCGRDYEYLLECVLREYEAMCVDGALTSSSCEYEQESYATCLAGG